MHCVLQSDSFDTDVRSTGQSKMSYLACDVSSTCCKAVEGRVVNDVSWRSSLRRDIYSTAIQATIVFGRVVHPGQLHPWCVHRLRRLRFLFVLSTGHFASD